MKRLLCLTLSVLMSPVAHSDDLAQHVLFKHYMGHWTAEGELKGENNNVVTIKEDWKGKAEGENTFVIEGTRTTNDDTQSFKWTYALNPSAGTCEALLTGTDGGQALRFEVNISDINLTLDMKAQTGQTSAILVKEEFSDDKHETLVSHVSFTNDQGQTTLEGDITHKKVHDP